MTARRVLLDGLARDADIFQLVSERADPLPLERPRERFLPERTFRGRHDTKHQYAVQAAAGLQVLGAIRGDHGWAGTEPDLLDELSWWQTDDFWHYALFAAVACIRAAASPAGVPVRQARQDLSQRPGYAAP